MVSLSGIFLSYSLTYTPPAALMSFTAYSYPGLTWVPSEPNLPVRGIDAPISMAAGAGLAVGACIGGTAVGCATGAGVAQLVASTHTSVNAMTLVSLAFMADPPCCYVEN